MTGAVVRVVEGADFYSYPRWAPAGADGNAAGDAGLLLSWRQWDHPDLPFQGVSLHWATWHPDAAGSAALTGAACIAGQRRQCVAEAAWAPDGSSLLFGMEPTDGGFRQLHRLPLPAKGEALAPSEPQIFVLAGMEDAEFGDASWFVGWYATISPVSPCLTTKTTI